MGVNEWIPHKNGKLYSKNDFKKEGFDKTNDALRSLDGEIKYRNNTKAAIFAKCVIGSGGYQDLIKRESIDFIEWAKKNNDFDIYIVLIDSDDLDLKAIKENESNKIWVGDSKYVVEKSRNFK